MLGRCLALPLLLATACGGATPAPGTPPGRPADAAAPAGPGADQLAAADHVAEAYLALTVDSIEPAPTRDTAALAWSVLGVGDAPAFGDDARANAALLRDAAGAIEPGAEWRAIAAMAGSTREAMLLDGDAIANLAALAAGAPSVGPGLVAHRDASGAAVVSEVVPGGPAEAAGLAVGDTIVAIDGDPPGRALVLPLLLRPPGHVDVVVDRAGQHVALDLELAAQPFPVVSTRIVGQAAVIRVHAITASTDPSRDTAALVRAAVAALDPRKVRGLVVDLRGCPGGADPIPTASALSAGDPLLIVRDVAGVDTAWSRRGDRVAWPHYADVLVDDQTAGAAELLAFALHDQGAMRVVGTPTLGAATVPEVRTFDDQHALRFPARSPIGPISRAPLRDGRVQPDQVVASPTAADLAAGTDAPLAAAIKWATRRKP